MTDLTGQIGLVPHAKTLVEWLIQVVTRSTVHHAIIAISATECISCEPSGAIIRPMSRFPDAYWSHFALPLNQKAHIVAWAVEHEGRKYGWLADAAIGVSLIFHVRTPRWVERHLNDGTRYECAQFCDAAYFAAGNDLFPDNRPPGTVYPGLFAHIWRAHGWMPTDG